MNPSSCIAIIPARGGSKRLPRKNIVDFLGRPIIAYTIEAALACRRFDRVVVSTEDPEIAAVASCYGAQTDRRPEELATDLASELDACLEFLDREAASGTSYRILACLYPTAVLRNSEDIAATLDLIEPGRCDFAMAVSRFNLYPHQALRLTPEGVLTPLSPDLAGRRYSEVGPLYGGNGSTYVASIDALRRHRTFYGPGLRGHVMPMARSVDIDESEDLEMARAFAFWNAHRQPFGGEP